MNKGIVIHLDNDPRILDSSRNLYDQMGINLELISCQSEKEFKSVIKERGSDIRALIFDLLSTEPSDGEINGKDAVFLKYVEESFAQYNIPIFIYSGFLEAIHDQFNGNGSVFKVDKEESFGTILEKIKLFHDSGFLEIFCQSGILENEIFEKLNASFKSQFRPNEIEKLIKSIQSSSGNGSFKKRTTEVFRRVALQSLMFDLLAPIAINQDMVNPIEHFYRRNNGIEVWTGDIWKKKDDSEIVFILTPRCDLATRKINNLIVCSLLKKELQLSGNREKRIKDLRNHLTDNILGNSSRYIPNTPFADGGFIDFSTTRTIDKKDLIANFVYEVTLSDGFTNEVTGKFTSYFLRTGILTINPDELSYYIDKISN